MSTPSRTERLRDVERAVRRVRWFGVAFAVAQISLIYVPPPGVEIPFPRLPVALAVGALLAAVNLASTRVERVGDERLLRRVGVAQLTVDTAVVFALILLFGFDETSRLWPLFLLPMLEGAMREGVLGALPVAIVGTVADGWFEIEVLGYGYPEMLASAAFELGILGITAIGAGLLAQRFEEARATAEHQSDRLARLAELSGRLAAQRRQEDVLDVVLEVACELVGVDRCEVHVHQDGAWTRAAGTGGEGAEPLPVIGPVGDDVVVIAPEVDPGADVTARQLLAAHISSGTDGLDGAGLLVLATTDPQRRFSEQDRDVVRLLAHHASIALVNARLVEAEERTIEELRDLDAMKDEFFHLLAHELRGPMTVLTGYAHVLRQHWDRFEPDHRDDMLASVQRGADRLARLVRDVEDVSEGDRGALQVEREVLELEPLVRAAAEEAVGGSRDHRTELVLHPATPPVVADADRLAQVLHNLLSNAVKYSPDGGLVRVTVEPVGGMVEVAVTDDGFGIPRHLVGHLFQRFARLPTPSRVSGTGLGLYLSRMLVEAMGGRISVQSEEGRGSTFRFTVPAAPAGAGLGPVAADAERVER